MPTGIVRINQRAPQSPRDWDQLFRRLNEQILDDGERAVLNELATLSSREGTNLGTILQRISDIGRATDQRFLPQVSAGNVLSLQNLNPLSASADATNATISIAAHTLRYGFGLVSYSAGTIVGLLPSTTYFVYADDPDYEGGAVSYFATTDRQNVTANNGRYFVGAIETAISANSAAIIGATSANPIVFETGTNHGWSTGNDVTLTSLPGDFGTTRSGSQHRLRRPGAGPSHEQRGGVMSLVELIAQADERGLAASAVACLDRCVPLLGGDDEVLRPLWASLADGDIWGDWAERVTKVRGELGPVDVEDGDGRSVDGSVEDEAALLARRMLAAVPGERSPAALREWADACSVAALRIHRLLDPMGRRAEEEGGPSVTARREGRTEGMSPLVAAELRRQVTVLELLAGHGANGVRQALDVSTEGRRVLRAVVSRRARGKV
jgi:hypothetical protein